MTPQPSPTSVDLNADMGEGFGAYTIGDDALILDIESSANVACGMHAGDPEIMSRVFGAARDRGVNVGAHPGFPDLWGFGRRDMPFSAGEIEHLVAYQVGAAQALSACAGHPISYVKAHGALAHRTFADEVVARAFARAIRGVDCNLGCLTAPAGHMARVAEEMGLRVIAEVFADRGYAEDGSLLPRSTPGALLHDPHEVAARALRMVRSGAIETESGALRYMRIDSVCVHSDTPGALVMARQIRHTLEANGISIRSFVTGR